MLEKGIVWIAEDSFELRNEDHELLRNFKILDIEQYNTYKSKSVFSLTWKEKLADQEVGFSFTDKAQRDKLYFHIESVQKEGPMKGQGDLGYGLFD